MSLEVIVVKIISDTPIDALIDDPNKRRVDNDNFKYDKVNFTYDAKTDSYTCPKGKELHLILSKDEKKNINAKNAWDVMYKKDQT